MIIVKMVPDDAGLQRLRADNEKPATARQVGAVARTRRVEKHHAEGEALQPIKPERRHKRDRRRAERRIRQRRVFLDTRSHRERRANPGNREEDEAQLPRSIDITI